MQADKFGSDFPVVCIFKKRRDTDTEGDDYIKQLGTDWGMPAYLCILEDGEDNSDGLEKLANVVCSKMNEYSSRKGSNCYPVCYMGNITQDIPRDKRHSLDHYVLTENVAKFARSYYEEEIEEGSFVMDIDLIDALFGRKENSVDPIYTLNCYG